MLYPIKFTPILKEMIWGGVNIPKAYNLDTNKDTKIGESYLLSALVNDNSLVENGELKGQSLQKLSELYTSDLLGKKVYDRFNTNFPLLIKIIDAADDLSIQVHPDDIFAKKQHNSFGKTEMWYVIDREKDAKIISGFSRKTSESEFQEYYNKGELLKLMQSARCSKGDVFFIPAGKVHSIGKGNIIAEIQQTSDLTYRIYDFERKDKNGKPRELHHQLALKAMNYADESTGKINYDSPLESKKHILTCKYFTTNIIETSSMISLNYNKIDSFVVLICLEGSCTIESDEASISIAKYESIFIPACINNVVINADVKSKFLEVYID